MVKVDLPEKYRKYSKTFCFLEAEVEKYIIMIHQGGIVKYNYMEETETQIYAFKEPLEDQPDYAVFDKSQKFCIIASSSQALWINISAASRVEIELDTKFKLSEIKCLMSYGEKFFLLANKLNDKLGYYLLEINTDYMTNPEHHFVIKWVNKLNIGNVDLDVITHTDVNEEGKEVVRNEIIISFKTIYENIYTVLVMEMDTYRILYKHNIYQLWESPVKGFLSTYAKDFIVLNKDGMSFIRLDEKLHRRQISDSANEMQPMVHSLHAAAYLKVENTNMIQFDESSSREEKCLVKIQQ